MKSYVAGWGRNTVWIWDLSSRELIHSFKSDDPKEILFTPDNQALAVLHQNRTKAYPYWTSILKLIDLRTFRKIADLKPRPVLVLGVREHAIADRP